jgi:hypothetical protein
MGRREELLREEAEWWGRLETLLAPLDDDEMVAPGVTPEGWAPRDVLWHVAWWSRDTARVLDAMREGTWDGSDPSTERGWTDRMNAIGFERSRSMPLVDVLAEFAAARRALLEAFGALEEIGPDADAWFEETGPTHYRKHVADLETWLGGAAGAP